MKASIKSSLLCLATLSLFGCGGSEVLTFKAVTAGLSATAGGFFSNPEINLRQKNYAVADYLIGKVRHIVSPHNLIVLYPLQEADHPGISSPLGRQIAEDISIRFAELGYSVRFEHAGKTIHTGQGQSKAVYTLGGDYRHVSGNVEVSVRMQDAQSGRLLTLFEYNIPATREVRKLSETETRIFKVSE